MGDPRLAGFDPAEYNARRRREERQNASDLLWENIEGGLWNRLRRLSGEKLTDLEKVEIQVNHYFPILAQFFSVSGHAIQSLNNFKVREILQYGASRRIGSIRKAIQNIVDIAPPNRKVRLSVDERVQVSDSILLLYVHMMGVLDAFAIAVFRSLELERVIKEREADLLNKKFRKLLSLEEVDKLVLRHDTWLTRIKEDLRNRFVHRIPPYVPDAAFNEAEAEQFAKLEEKKFKLLIEGDLDAVEKVQAEQDALGVFKPVLTFSENNAHMLLHPTILDDTYRFICLIFDLLEITLPLFEKKLGRA